MSTALETCTCCSTRWPVVPTPDVAQRTAPGLAFAAEMTAASVSPASARVPTTSTGVIITLITGVTSLSGSKPVGPSSGAIVSGLTAENTSVRPSGGARFRDSIATTPPAPPRFSTITGTPSCVAARSASARAIESLTPPGGYATRIASGPPDGAGPAQSNAVANAQSISPTLNRTRRELQSTVGHR